MDHEISSDTGWLQKLQERAVAQRWCVKINCTICGAHDYRTALKDTPDPTIITGLGECQPIEDSSNTFEEAVSWVLYDVWRKHGDRFDQGLEGTWAGKVLDGMKARHTQRLEAQRINYARQGVKKSDRKE